MSILNEFFQNYLQGHADSISHKGKDKTPRRFTDKIRGSREYSSHTIMSNLNTAIQNEN